MADKLFDPGKTTWQKLLNLRTGVRVTDVGLMNSGQSTLGMPSRAGHYRGIPEDDYPDFTVQWMTALAPKMTPDASVFLVICPHLRGGVLSDYVWYAPSTLTSNRGHVPGDGPVLSDYLRKAVLLNAERLEIEYKDGQEWITAFRGDMGFGIGSVDSTERDMLFEGLKQLKKSKRITISGKEYRLSFSEYESFGETVYEIQWKKKA